MRRAERRHAPPPERAAASASPDWVALKRAGDAEQGGKQCDAPRNSGWRPGAKWARSEDERVIARPLPGVDETNGGADACWAGETRADVARRVATIPVHQRPPMREMGRRSEAAEHPYKRLPGDEGGPMVSVRSGGEGVRPNMVRQPVLRRDPAAQMAAWNAMPSIRYPGDGPHPDKAAAKERRCGSNDPGAQVKEIAAFFDTGRSTAGTIARVCGPLPYASRAGLSGSHVSIALDTNGEEGLPYPGITASQVYPPAPSKTPSPRASSIAEAHASSPRESTETEANSSFLLMSNQGEARPSPFVSSEVETQAPPSAPHYQPAPANAGAQSPRTCGHAPPPHLDPGVRRGGLYPKNPAPPPDDPLVLVHKVGSRIEVAAACPLAQAMGVEPGVALTQVRAATPDIAVREADAAGDRADLERLAAALARRWSPVVAISDADALAIDLTGVAHLHGGEDRMAARLVRLLARLGVTTRIGIADTAGAAWALARHATSPRAPVAALPPGGGLEALAPLPLAALRIDDAAQELLRRLGVDTVGQLAALPRAPLVRRFGRAVTDRLDQVAGRVAEPLNPVVVSLPIAVEQRFAEPLLTAEPIAHWIAQLVPRLCAALSAAGRGARAVALAATRVDGAVQVIRIGHARPTRDPAAMLRLLLRQVERIDPGFGIEGLALHVLRADPLGAEALAGDLACGTEPDLAPLVDAIVARIGARRLWRTRPEQSDVPERSVASAAPLADVAPPPAPLRREDVRRLDARAPDHPWHPRWPRPARLLRRPERVDEVMAGLPDDPPARFTWRGERHRVVRGDGPKRITGEWWHRPAERAAVRDYYVVEDEAGRRFWLFRRGDGERAETGDLSWYIHGTFA